MEVRFKPDQQAKLDELATENGRPTSELVEDVVAGYLDELAWTRDMLNSRYDDLKSGRVKPISRDEVVAQFREKSAADRVMDYILASEARDGSNQAALEIDRNVV